MTYTVRHIGTVTVQAESEAALEAMLQHFGYWKPESVAEQSIRSFNAAMEKNDVLAACDALDRFDAATMGTMRAPRPPREFVTNEVE